MALKEFESAGELRAFYREVHARTSAWAPAPPPPPEPEPAAPPPPEPPPAALLPRIRLTPGHRIAIAVAREFHVPLQLIRSDSRLQAAVVPRQVVALLSRELTNMSYKMIGKLLGHRDHTTVIAALRSIQHKMSRNVDLARRVERLRAHLLEEDEYAGAIP